jgi:hypothetical protein
METACKMLLRDCSPGRKAYVFKTWKDKEKESETQRSIFSMLALTHSQLSSFGLAFMPQASERVPILAP